MMQFKRGRWNPSEQDCRLCCGKWIRKSDRKIFRVVPNSQAVENEDDDLRLDEFLGIGSFNWVMSFNEMTKIEGIPEQCIPKSQSQYYQKPMECYNVQYPTLRGIFQ